MEPKIFVCEPCNFKSKYKLSLDNHLVSTLHLTGKKKVRSDKVRLDKCPKCDYETYAEKDVVFHVKSIHEKNFSVTCEFCDYSCLTFDRLRRHKKTHASILHCELCDYQCNYKIFLKQHVRKAHIKAEETYNCPLCDYYSPYRGTLNRHLNVHAEFKR